MLVYRDGGRSVETRREQARLLQRAPAAVSRTGALALLIEIGEFEAAVADVLPEGDPRAGLVARQMRLATCAAARAWLSPGSHGVVSVEEALQQIPEDAVPLQVSVRVSEGYAFYALYPDAYALSARRFHHDRRPTGVAVIGIRSIGTSLSAVVAAALEQCGCSVTAYTVRPHGDPYDRRVTLGSDLEGALRADVQRGATFAVVDEGPGISGSSFAAVVQALRDLGIPSSSIVLFPSWDPEPAALRSETAREVWRQHVRYCATAVDAGVSPEQMFGVAEPVDFSAGRWRERLLGAEGTWPAVQPQHERWKVFDPDAPRILKFVGLGAYGVRAYGRAHALAGHGVAVAPAMLRDGFLELPFVHGTPLDTCGSIDEAKSIGRYVGVVARSFPRTKAADVESLVVMIERNTRDLPLADRSFSIPGDVAASAIDGRMLAHEWIRTPSGLVKVDGLDHAADHFFPGWQSPAWDLAGAWIECAMHSSLADAMLEEFERTSGNRDARRLLPFYSLAYAAFRYGYARLAAETVQDVREAERFTSAAARYSQWALKAAASLKAASKSPRKQMARSSMNT